MAKFLIFILVIVTVILVNQNLKLKNQVNQQTQQEVHYWDTSNWEQFQSDKYKVLVKLPIDLDFSQETASTYEFIGALTPITQPTFLFTTNITNFSLTPVCTDTTTQAPCIVPVYSELSEKDQQEILIDRRKARKFKVWRTVGRYEIVAQTIEGRPLEFRMVDNLGDELFDSILSTVTFLD